MSSGFSDRWSLGGVKKQLPVFAGLSWASPLQRKGLKPGKAWFQTFRKGELRLPFFANRTGGKWILAYFSTHGCIITFPVGFA
jgi:hypothetical protein